MLSERQALASANTLERELNEMLFQVDEAQSKMSLVPELPANQRLGYAQLQQYIQDQVVMDQGFMRILSNSGIVVAHKNFDRVGDFSGELDDQGQGDYIDIIQNGDIHTSIEYSTALKQNTFKSLAPIKVAGSYWTVGTILTQGEIMAESNKRIMIMVVIALLILASISVLILLIASSVGKSLLKVTGLAGNIAEFDITKLASEDLLRRKDEVGVLANAFNKILSSLKTFIDMNMRSVQVLSDNADSLTCISKESAQTADQISSTIQQVAFGAGESGRGFAVVAEEIRELAEESDKFTQEIAIVIQDLRLKTEEAVETMDQMNQVVDEQSESVENTNSQFQGIAEAVETTKQIIEKLNESRQLMDEGQQEIIANISNLAAVTQEKSSEKIDGAVATIMALDRAICA